MKLRAFLASTAALITSAALTVAAAAPTHAAETYRAGPDVGVHYDAEVACSSHPHLRVDVRPIIGTTPGWEWGQNVAFRVYVLDSRGVAIRSLRPNNAWTTTTIATTYTQYNAIGQPYTVIDPYKVFGPYRWNLPTGNYTVRVDYAWQTNRGWSYATNVTSLYMNYRATFAGWLGTFGSRCVIAA